MIEKVKNMILARNKEFHHGVIALCGRKMRKE